MLGQSAAVSFFISPEGETALLRRHTFWRAPKEGVTPFLFARAKRSGKRKTRLRETLSNGFPLGILS